MNRNFGRDFILALSRAEYIPHRYRSIILRWAGISVGKNFLMMPGCRFVRSSVVRFGSNVFVNYDCYFDALATIEVGDDCQVGDHVHFITSTHAFGSGSRRAGVSEGHAISIGNGVWIGSGAKVLPGVTIGDGVVIAAGAVVVRDCEPHSLYAGVPAQLVKSLPI